MHYSPCCKICLLDKKQHSQYYPQIFSHSAHSLHWHNLQHQSIPRTPASETMRWHWNAEKSHTWISIKLVLGQIPVLEKLNREKQPGKEKEYYCQKDNSARVCFKKHQHVLRKDNTQMFWHTKRKKTQKLVYSLVKYLSNTRCRLSVLIWTRNNDIYHNS